MRQLDLEVKQKHFGDPLSEMCSPISANLLNLERTQIHEILEKMTHSLNRKFKRNQDWGTDVRESGVYELVIKMQHCFDKKYGLSRYVRETLAGVDEFYLTHIVDKKTGNWIRKKLNKEEENELRIIWNRLF